MSELIDKYYKVLDDGFIALKGYMGSDQDIERAARVSYGKGTRKVSDTRNLLRFMFSHAHTSPFESCELQFHVRSPIFCFRQWHRHRTWSFSEYSGRYSEMIDSCEVTDKWRVQSTINKQGSGTDDIKWPENFNIPSDYYNENKELVSYTPDLYLSNQEKQLQKQCRAYYEERLAFGVAKEQARKELPVSNYSEMYAKVDLKNLLHFISLRSDSHAQLEIRLYSDILAGIVRELFPITFEAWKDYQFNAVRFSRMEVSLLNFQMQLKNSQNPAINDRDLIVAKAVELGMSKREIEEFASKLEVKPEQDFSLDQYEVYSPNVEI